MRTKVEEIINNVDNGDLLLLDAIIELKEISKECETIISICKNFEKESINEIELLAKDYDNKYHGYEFKVVQGRKMYNFKNISEWQTYSKAIKDCEARYKIAFESHQKGINSVSDDGEILELPEVSYGSSYCTLKKQK